MDKYKIKNYISTNLKYLRNLNGKSLKDIGNICDKTDVAVHYWENGTREPNAIDIGKLSNYFNVNVDDLIFKDLRFDNSKNDEDIIKSNKNDETTSRFNILYDKIRDLPEDKQKIIFNVTESIIKEIDEKDDNN